MPHRSAQSTARRGASAAPLFATGALALSLLVGGAPEARAQAAGEGFLFDAPRWTMTLRGGFDRASAGSDIFQFMTDTLTLSKGDFSGFTFGGDLAFSISPSVTVGVGGSFVRSKSASEFRYYFEEVGTDSLPIVQNTTFARIPISATIRFYPTPRGRSIGTLAWIPARFAPYLGGGLGAMWYDFHQEGDFVFARETSTDEYDIAYDDFRSAGWTPTAHAVLGAEFALTPRLGFSAEGRSGGAKSDLSDDFVGFEPIDLSGFSTTIGLTLRL